MGSPSLTAFAGPWSHPAVPRQRDPQTLFRFARPGPSRGGLPREEHDRLVERLRADAGRVAARFSLPPFALDADRPNATDRYGQCEEGGRITVRLVHARTGKPLRYSALIDTVIHELAHLRYMSHGPRWEALYRRMLEWARAEGIYEPRSASADPPAPPPAPNGQLDLL